MINPQFPHLLGRRANTQNVRFRTSLRPLIYLCQLKLVKINEIIIIIIIIDKYLSVSFAHRAGQQLL